MVHSYWIYRHDVYKCDALHPSQKYTGCPLKDLPGVLVYCSVNTCDHPVWDTPFLGLDVHGSDAYTCHKNIQGVPKKYLPGVLVYCSVNTCDHPVWDTPFLGLDVHGSDALFLSQK